MASAGAGGKQGSDEDVATLEGKLGIPQASIQRQALSRILTRLLSESTPLSHDTPSSSSSSPSSTKDEGPSGDDSGVIFSMRADYVTAPPQISGSPYFRLLTRNCLAHSSPLVAEGAVTLVPPWTN
jgi:hypothetical protein